MTGGSTRVFAVIGDPVAHSISPAMHGAAFRALGLDAVYVALRASGDDVGPLLRVLCGSGGGASIMAPNKRAAAELLDLPTDRVRDAGGCNAVWGTPAGTSVTTGGTSVTTGGTGADAVPLLAGDNTDVDGVLLSMRELCIDGGAWLVAGTGGGARAVAIAARELGASVAVRSRSPERARRFEEWLRAAEMTVADPRDCTVLVNATPLGRAAGDPLPLDRAAIPNAVVALDLVYTPGETPWVRAMRARGLRAIDGRTMLLGQGIAAFARWFPGIDPPDEVMRAALDRELR